MSRRLIVQVGGLAMLAAGVGFMTAQDKPAKGPDRDADKQAIEKLSKDFIHAFNARDAAAVAAIYTADGEYMRNDGEPIRGRDPIRKGYADFFKTLKGKSTLEIQIDSLRFPSADSAMLEVTVRLKNAEGELIASSWRNSMLVREGGAWKVALVQEWDRDDGLDVKLSELEWLIGAWSVTAKDREVSTVYEWDENRAFIRGRYTVKEAGKVVESGTQMIGKDNSARAIHSWIFSSDGGFGEGLWTRDGKKWTVNVSGVTPDGRELAATALYILVDANTYTWQSTDQTVDGDPIPDTQPIKVTKQKKK